MRNCDAYTDGVAAAVNEDLTCHRPAKMLWSRPDLRVLEMHTTESGTSFQGSDGQYYS